MKNSKAIKVGVIGSMADFELSELIKKSAKELGKELAINNSILMFGFEGDFSSVSEIAARSTEEFGGKTVAFIRGNKKQDLNGLNSTQIITKQLRGGGREFPFILSCDAIISVGGGSGTLMEIAMAYQAKIPIIALKNSGGWSQKLAGTFLDGRKHIMILPATSSKEAVRLAIKEVKKSLPGLKNRI